MDLQDVNETKKTWTYDDDNINYFLSISIIFR